MGSLQIIQLFSGAVGCIGFGLIFNLRRRYLPLAAIGGFFGWLVYLLCSLYVWPEGIFLPTLAASFVTAMYAEFLARRCHAPSTPFFLTAVIPLVPGSTLYYCIDALVQNEGTSAQRYGVMRHVASGANGSLISVFSPLGLCQTVTCGTL